ncbi:M16 family metallopeptidase [Acidicapsa ligni]|uniref:M16 family metallopeptidase n=1 Tax=Acidicapsa ligni TaxID=542300 RepID=UPI0021E0A581|nr:pitrilysin family protein [Acidicapsa ligni]
MNNASSSLSRALVVCAGLACGMLLSFSVPAFAQPTSAPLKVPDLKYEKYTLPNGLEVILREDHRLPLVAVDLWYHVGPVNEKAGRTGFAHLFEHMMFEGSEHVGEKAHFKYLEGAGATDINGTTSYDRTNYFETIPSNELDLALWLESDRMGFLLETLDRAKLTNQRDVVRNELRQDEGNPYDVADEAVGHLLFPKGHPYYGNVIGSHADVEAARLLDVRDFFHHFYTPNNASISIVGDFDAATIKEKVAKFFGPIPAGPVVEKVKVETPQIATERRVTVTDTVQLPRLSVAWLSPEAFHPGDEDTDMFVNILGGGKISRLYQKLVYQDQIAQSVNCSNQSMMVTSIASCDIIARPGVKLEDLEAAFDKEVELLRKDGPTQAELDRARNQSLSGLIQGLQRLGGFGGVADMMDRYNQYLGDPGYLPKDVARYEAITPAGVKKVGQDVFGKNQRVVVYCIPGKKVTEDVPRSPADTDATVKVTPPYAPEFETAQDWRKEAPKPGPEPTLHLPTPTTFELANGVKVYLIEEHALPVVSASLVTLAGGEENPKDKAGLAGFTARLLSEGTTTRSSTQLANDVARIGAELSASASMDSANVSVGALSNNTAPALELLSDVALHPAFKAEEVERIRQQRLVGILQEADQPISSVLRVGNKVLYGDQPYGFQPVGTTESVKAMTRDDLTGFWSAHYAPKNAALILAGDLTESEAKQMAEKYFGGWSSSTASATTAIPAPPAAPARKVVIVDKPGSPQTTLITFGLGVPRNTPDYAAITEMNSILGGLFSSRINMNLREKNGFTYGAFSGFFFYRLGGPFYSGAQVRTDITGPATHELFAELNRIHTDPATPEELKLAKDNALRTLPGDFETVGNESGLMAELFVYGLPTDYFQKLPAAFQAVTPEAVAQAAKAYIHPDNLIVVAVGDRAKIEPELEKLNLGPIEYRDESGGLLKK